MGDGGRIIATDSVLGDRVRPGFAAYAAAKAGVVALAKVLASELAEREILVNVVAPGWFDSPLAEGWMANPTLERRILDHTLLGRWGRSEEIAGPYLFLASDAAAFVTGTVLAVDGGYLVP
jgi:NAD(P)-dependent dehydrogenase (short-subunit alcohol dehydrogenase family)